MLFRILILLFVLLIVPDVYIYYAYVRHWTNKWHLRLITYLPSIALLIYMGLVLSHDDMHLEHQTSVGRFMMVFLAITVPRFIFTLLDPIGLLGGAKFRRYVRLSAMTIAFFSVILLGYGYFIGRNRYVVERHTMEFQTLPKAFDGYRIAHFSDLHLGTFHDGHQDDVNTIVELINSLDCDVILFTGDLVNYESRESDGFRRVLSRLKARDGVYAIMGNHDYSMYIKTLTPEMVKADIEELQRRERSYGWKLLLNDNAIIRRGNDSIVIIGSENDGTGRFPALGDLPKATHGLTGVLRTAAPHDSVAKAAAHPFSVLLTHDPTHWRRRVLPETTIDLTLSGHTHAGQFKVFGWSPIAFVYDEWSGIYQEGSQLLNVTDGVGQVMFPFRFGAWPEIDVITLKVKGPLQLPQGGEKRDG